MIAFITFKSSLVPLLEGLWRTWLIHMWQGSSMIWCIFISNDSILCDAFMTWRILTWHDSLICDKAPSYVTWLIHDVTHLYVTWCIYEWHDTTHSYVTWLVHMWHDSFCDMTLYVTKRIQVPTWHYSFICDMTHSWHDTFLRDMTLSYVTWYNTFVCDIAHSYMMWLIRDMTYSYVTWRFHMWHDTMHSYVAWLIHTWRDSFVTVSGQWEWGLLHRALVGWVRRGCIRVWITGLLIWKSLKFRLRICNPGRLPESNINFVA